ncbi:bifunctional phosphoribosylaminoimidazolecarboxamide formyltransferase/IMP cyclohydrolase [Candidatus Woesearchaeota archaeon B3_Woes]|nr:MAG: bifunctional phosphoribosylaminoimidazolecarboxamide formyltransferase/IMP cyclohydrolase [Candidatus Woesearchaeota archaeon B3_Woes]
MDQKNRALITVTDKTNLDILAEGLSHHNYEIISTGGTSRVLREIIEENGYDINVIDVSDVTGYPELFDGRVKTLHPAILGGILFDRSNPEHVQEAKDNNIVSIDLVVNNLYPFESTAAKPGATEDDIIENMDIGGPTATISAVKNWKHVGVLADPAIYETIISEMDLNNGVLTKETRRDLAAFAINTIADYRSANAVELTRRFTGEETLRRKFVDGKELGRYGENWHQKSWLFVDPNISEPNAVIANQVHGGPLGYNNFLDAEAALRTVKEYKDQPTVVVIKHSEPCGIATADTLENALERAWQGDPVSAFGSVIAFNREVDLDTMKVICDRPNTTGKKGWFVEAMIAPSVSPQALEYVQGKKTKSNLRILEVGDMAAGVVEDIEYRELLGGILKQERDSRLYLTDTVEELFREPYQLTCQNSQKELTVGIVTETKPKENSEGLYDFAMKAAKHTKSNAIVICREYSPGQYQVLGMGAGQPNRKDAGGKLAITKAHENLEMEYQVLANLEEATEHAKAMLTSEYDTLMDSASKVIAGQTKEQYIKTQLKDCCLASDAFFPFRDGLDAVAGFGIKNVIQPGGSNGDPSVIEAANEYDIAMVFTGMRHFKH